VKKYRDIYFLSKSAKIADFDILVGVVSNIFAIFAKML